jgi:hypothetical protein
VHQHAAAAAGGVVDRVAGLRLQDAHQRVHHLGRGEELAGLGAGVVGELLDQILVGAAEHVGRHALVREVMGVEVLDQRVDHLVRNQRLATAVRRGLVPVDGEDAAQLLVGAGDTRASPGQLLTRGWSRRRAHRPSGCRPESEAMLAARSEDRLLCVRELAALLPLQLGDGVVRLVLPLVAEPLVEHQRQDVVLVVLPGCLARAGCWPRPRGGFELLLV